MPSDVSPRPAAPSALRLALDLGPLLIFLAAFKLADLYWATGVFMLAITVSLGASWWIERRIPPMPLVTAAFVLVLGGLTIYLQDETFIKLKPTLASLLFAAILFAGLIGGRPLLKPLLGSALQMDERGWRTLTLRWGVFFVVLAALNEVMWRNFSNDVWVNFKVFGILGLTFAFMLSQAGMIQRHSAGEEAPADEADR